MTLRRLALAVAALGLATPAHGQFPGNIPNNTVLGNTSGAAAPARPVSISTLTGTVGCGLASVASVITASGRTAYTDSSGDVLLSATSNYDALTNTLTTDRFWTLPLASFLPAGCTLKIADEQGGVTATEQLIIVTDGSDLINGGAAYPLDGPYQAISVTTDGVSNWTVTSSVTKANCDAGTGTPNTIAKFVTDPYATCGDSLITNVSPDILASPGANGHFIVQVESASGDGGIRLSSGNGLAGTDGGGNINLTTGNGAASGDGGSFNLIAGNGGATTGTGGAVNITSGGATNSNAGEIRLLGADSDNANDGGRIRILAGGGVAANGGAIIALAGQPATGDGGAISLSAGTPGAGSGGAASLIAGDGATDGIGGNLTLRAGNSIGSHNGGDTTLSSGSAADGFGGTLTLSAGAAATGGVGGVVAINGGASTAGQGGHVTVTAGDGGGAGGIVTLQGGAATDVSATPGDIHVFAGTANSGAATQGGSVAVEAGNGDAAAGGGNLAFAAGQGGSTNGAGGAISLTGGTGAGTGSGGQITLTAGPTATGTGGYISLAATQTGGTQSAVPGDANPIDGYIGVAAGHLVTGVGTASPTTHGTLSSCGGGTPAFETSGETDTSGVITVGTGVVTACTLTFKRTWNAIVFSGAYVAPKCFANNVGATPNAISISARSITAVTFTFAADINTTGGKFQYFCVQ